MSAAPDNVFAIGAALDQPVDAPRLGQEGDDHMDPRTGDDDDDDVGSPRLPKDAPVRALGVKDQTCFYLDVKGQLIALGPRDHSKNNIISLFTPKTHLPTKYWPQWSAPKTDRKTKEIIEPSRIVGFDQSDASEALIRACGEAGIFDVEGKLRSRGAHLGAGGALVLHYGDKILVAAPDGDARTLTRIWHEPGVIDRYVYPSGAPIARPSPDAVSEKAGEKALAILQTWRWKRPLLDAMLALGWLGQTYLCGALDWRSHVFVTGGKGTGKSTLNGKNGFFDRVLGAGVLRTASATEAAVRQRLGAQTLPVIFDEFEQSEFNAARTRAIVELARIGSSGDSMDKGGADHQARQFTMHSAFMFSAILMPKMLPADRSRFAVLELDPFPVKAVAPKGEGIQWPIEPHPEEDKADRGIDLEALQLPELGRALHRRMVDGWARWRETWRLYRRALERVGHSPRGCDTFGTLLACADLLLYDHLPDRDQVDEWAAKCRADELAEIANMTEEHDACINHLAFAQVQARGGDERSTVAAWLGEALKLEGGSKYEHQLEPLGLRLVTLRPTRTGKMGARAYLPTHPDPAYLAIAGEQHAGLSAIYRDSRWMDGGWTQALGRVDGAHGSIAVKFNGRMMRATCIPIGAVLSDEREEGTE